MNKIKKGQVWIAADGRMRVVDKISPSGRLVRYFDSVDCYCLGETGKHIQVASFLKWIRRSGSSYWYYFVETKTPRFQDSKYLTI